VLLSLQYHSFTNARTRDPSDTDSRTFLWIYQRIFWLPPSLSLPTFWPFYSLVNLYLALSKQLIHLLLEFPDQKFRHFDGIFAGAAVRASMACT